MTGEEEIGAQEKTSRGSHTKPVTCCQISKSLFCIKLFENVDDLASSANKSMVMLQKLAKL